jgi:electron transport complex protein RnfG
MKNLIPAITLIIVCAVSAILLSLVHDATYVDNSGTITPAIKTALTEIYGHDSGFEIITLDNTPSAEGAYISLAMKCTANSDNEAAFVVVSDGYSKGGLTLLVGLDKDGAVKGIVTLESGETPGLGSKTDTPEFRGQFEGFTADKIETPIEADPENDNKKVRFPKSKEELEALKAAAPKPVVLFEWDAVTGATLSSNGMYNAVKLAVTAFKGVQ